MNGSAHVLVVDDEHEISEVLAAYLRREGMSVETAGSVREARAALTRRPPNILILDVTLPDGSGLDVLRDAGAQDVPTILLTARADEADRVVGLELGADDYVTKPFSPREVVARVRSILRRSQRARSGKEAAARTTQIGAVEINHEFHEVMVGGKPIALTATEFKILELLAENPGEVFTRAHLLDRLGDRGEVFERTLDRHINNVRKKIERDPRQPQIVLTVYGVGYKVRRP